MGEHQGLITNRYGNPTTKSDPDIGIYNHTPYIKGTFTLGLSLPANIGILENIAIAYYEDEIGAWVDFPSYEKGGYLYADGLRIKGVFAIIKKDPKSDFNS